MNNIIALKENVAELRSWVENCFDMLVTKNSQPQARELDVEDWRWLEKIETIFTMLSEGILRVAEKKNDSWVINDWVKKAILLGFKLKKTQDQAYDGYDKIGLLEKSERYRKVPGAIVREGAYIGNQVVLMPCFVNIGAYVADNTMIDINATIGSCAQIGCNCHVSASSVIGGVLEPIVASPVIVEDNCFIGAGSNILDGVLVQENSIIASGVTISSSTKIIERDTKKIHHKVVPAGSVVVSGSYPSDGLNIGCAVIIKKNSKQTREKTDINEMLRM